MWRLLRRRSCRLQLAAVLMMVTFVHLLWTPRRLGGARLSPSLPLVVHRFLSPNTTTKSTADEMAPPCSGLNVTANTSTASRLPWRPVPSPQLGKSGPYCVLYDWLEATHRPAGNQSVTLCSHATADSAAGSAPVLAAAWRAPVSLAIFVLPEEVCALASRLAHLRRCDVTFRRHVSVHLVYYRLRAPSLTQLPAVEEMAADCGRPPPTAEQSRRRELLLPYPVNVARNAARLAARTYHVLVSDDELVPSPGAVNMFMKMMERRRRDMRVGQSPNATNREVFVLPVFEVQHRLPTSKADLVKMIRAKEAVWFHRFVCPHCQKFPNVQNYPNKPFTPGRLQAFSTVRRQAPYHRWEPIYIGTKAEPFYDERLSWEGKQDKMTQMTELCLRQYRLVILDQVFLTHVPQPGGIRHQAGFTDPGSAWRTSFIRQNQRVYDQIMKGFKLKYGNSKQCMVR